MCGEEGFAGARVLLEPRAGPDQGDPPGGERIGAGRDLLCDEEARPGVRLEVLGVRGEPADQEDRVGAVEGEGDEGAVGVAGRIEREGPERPHAAPGDQRGPW